MEIGPGNAILELCKTEKVSTQFQVSQLLVISLYSITKSVPDPFIGQVLMTDRHESSSAKKHDLWSSKNKKGTYHVYYHVCILAIPCNTTESVQQQNNSGSIERNKNIHDIHSILIFSKNYYWSFFEFFSRDPIGKNRSVLSVEKPLLLHAGKSTMVPGTSGAPLTVLKGFANIIYIPGKHKKMSNSNSWKRYECCRLIFTYNFQYR